MPLTRFKQCMVIQKRKQIKIFFALPAIKINSLYTYMIRQLVTILFLIELHVFDRINRPSGTGNESGGDEPLF